MSLQKSCVFLLIFIVKQIILDQTSKVSPSKKLWGNQQLLDNITAFVFNIENKTKGLFDINTLHNCIINASGKKTLNKYMIQKEKEKLTIIPMSPVKMETINKNILSSTDEYFDPEVQQTEKTPQVRSNKHTE